MITIDDKMASYSSGLGDGVDNIVYNAMVEFRDRIWRNMRQEQPEGKHWVIIEKQLAGGKNAYDIIYTAAGQTYNDIDRFCYLSDLMNNGGNVQ